MTVAFPIEDLLGLKPETGNMIHERHHHMTRGQAFKGVYGFMRGTIQKVHLLNALTVVATILKGTLTWLPPIKHVHGCRKQSVHGLEKDVNTKNMSMDVERKLGEGILSNGPP